jgi:hypothetical protein
MISEIINFLRVFNDITAPFGFIITISTFVLARATKVKLDESKEIGLFSEEANQFLGRLSAIKIFLDQMDNRFATVPEYIIKNVSDIVSEMEHSYPTLSKKNKVFSKPIKQFKKLQRYHFVEYIDFIDSFNALYSILSNRKDLK